MTIEEAVADIARKAGELIADRQERGLPPVDLTHMAALVHHDLGLLQTYADARGAIEGLGLLPQSDEDCARWSAWLVGTARSMAVLALALYATAPEVRDAPSPDWQIH